MFKVHLLKVFYGVPEAVNENWTVLFLHFSTFFEVIYQ